MRGHEGRWDHRGPTCREIPHQTRKNSVLERFIFSESGDGVASNSLLSLTDNSATVAATQCYLDVISTTSEMLARLHHRVRRRRSNR
jgi:hypothetical protein